MLRSATAALDQIQRMEKAAQAMQSAPLEVSTAHPPEKSNPPDVTPGNAGTIRYLNGTIVAVDCWSSPKTLMTVSTGKSWSMQVAETRRVLLLGVDVFSCNWSKQEVASELSRDRRNDR